MGYGIENTEVFLGVATMANDFPGVLLYDLISYDLIWHKRLRRVCRMDAWIGQEGHPADMHQGTMSKPLTGAP